MKLWRDFAFLIVAALAMTAARASILDAALFPGRVTSFYGPIDASDAEGVALMQGIREGRLAENLAESTRSAVLLKKDMSVGVEKCGEVNAFFQPSARKLVFCLELIRFIAEKANEQGIQNRPKGKEWLAGVIFAVYAHELAHALISIDNIPITGREEDVADQFATYYSLHFLEPAGYQSIGPAVWFYRTLGQKRGPLGSMSEDQVRHVMSNEHSLDQQRVFNVACWAYGANPKKAETMVAAIGMDPQRKERCAGEFARMNAGIRSQFGRYLRH